MAKTQKYDLIIAGGGTVGCLLALSLATSGLKIAVVEARAYARDPLQSPHPGFDSRSIALSHQSASYLNHLGLQTKLQHNSTPIKQIKVSDQGHTGQCLLDHRQQGVGALGYVISQQQLGTMLYEPVKDSPDIKWHCPDSIAGLRQHQQHIEVSLTSGGQLSAQLLIVAEGGKSATANMLGPEPQIDDYRQVAIVANVQTDQPHESRAYERFTAQGPLALLPNRDKGFGLVWSVAVERLGQLEQMADAAFLQQLQQAFGYSAGRFCGVGRRDSYPLALVRLDRTIAHRAVVIGNAAHTLHPIAGQGFNLGLRDAECLANLLLQANKQNADLGEPTLLQAYGRQREQDQQQVINRTDALVRFFSNRHWPLTMGRNLGLGLLDMCPPLRFRLAQSAMGYGGRNGAD
ncbi:2-octaprenyl-6-methoxyphenyl hydroxylase [Lacimicrobium alkaliphilum]|uniref:FAD-binding domain-containing protein n=1 Tax=Lacimicrobium alkaliphilum TaxID=1526571 RepID=A0A0U2ZKH9_9ALTE|nr:2-octaprenyl-6-methoxyphenyl hydroxylase [Lacimicrobium alkaliphilum]ALS99511.1 hypothetical protein AT746_15420 [Lacimicrobium alkaliphilum]